jgi:ATP-binding cassette subfamily B protein
MMYGFRLAYAGANAGQAVAALSKTGSYLLLRYLIDQVLGRAEVLSLLPWIAAGFVGLALVEGGASALSGRLAAYTAEGITRRLRDYLYDHIQRLSFTYHDQMSTGELIQRATSDVDSLRRFYAEQAIGIGRILMLFSVNFIALQQLNSTLAWSSVVVVPVIVVVSVLFFRRLSKAYERYQEQEAKLSTVLQENLTGVRVVKAFARQDYETNKFERENWGKYGLGRRFVLMHAAFWPVSDILCGAQMVFGYFLGATMAINGTISVGTYLAYVGLLMWMIFPMRNLGRLIVQLSTGLVSYGRVTKVIHEEREPVEDGEVHPEGNVTGEIVYRDVSFEYQANTPVLKDISFEARPGQAIALLGSTGSGKTTLVNLLPRFYEYSGGHIMLDGIELNCYPRHYLRQQIGIVEQEPFLFSRTIRENITYGVGREVTQEEIEAAARAAAIHDVIAGFPEGYGTLVGERGVTLSGGQKQRVVIARTLLKDPRILILDDSTSSVDMETEAAIRGALDKLMHGRTTFIIAHRIQSLMRADLILVLDKGRIVQRGTHAELMEQAGFYRKIYDLQARIETELERELALAA